MSSRLAASPRVLLVYPEFPDTYWSFRHALAFVRKKSAFPPLGLATVASMLPKTWERRLVDMNVRTLERSDILWADVVFVSAMLVQKASLERVVALCRSLGKRVVVGGPYVSTNAQAMSSADHLFVGESEATLPEFVADLERGEPRRVYRAEERPSLALTPVPDFSLLELERYSSMSVQYSRGCPFQCEFCDIIEVYGRVPRTKSNEQMLVELDTLLATGWRGPVFVVDDNFIGNKKNVRRLLPELADWSERNDYPFSFFTEASVNLADDAPLLAMMRQAGFRRVFLGIETPVEASLVEAQKGQNRKRDLVESVRTIQSYGMEVMAGFIVGFDNDPEDIFDRQIDFIQASAIPLAMVGLLTALPETQLWRRLEREGRLVAESSGDNTDCSLNFVPKMDPRRLIEGYRSVLQAIYSSAAYYRRVLASLERVADARPIQHTAGIAQDLVALGRVVMTLGVRDGERAEFWRFLARVVADHRDKFPHAVRLAAMGYHFRKLTASYTVTEPAAVTSGWSTRATESGAAASG
jgi:radical SAM superfamily enzyme YgiQ (UPF0313 family)